MRRRAGGQLARATAALALGLLVGGCALGPPLDLAALAGADRKVRLAEVPFFPQTAHQCGPAALAAVLSASGVPSDPDELSRRVYLPGREGSLQAELLAATRRAGRIPYLLDTDPAALLAELEARRAVLVMQNLLTPGVPRWHYAVLAGFDTRANRFVLNSGEQLPARAFLRSWDWAGRWAFVALAPGEIPQRADPARFSEALLDFERVAPRSVAMQAWQAAAARWARQPLAWLALGNLAHADTDIEGAIGYYRRGLEAAPGDPALANNLATALGEAGCARAGEAVLAPVLAAQASDPTWSALLEATREELAAHGGTDAGCSSEIRRRLQPSRAD